VSDNQKSLYGGFFRRFFAFIIDFLVVMLPSLIIVFVYFLILGDAEIDDGTGEKTRVNGDAVMLFVSLLVGLIYWPLMESSAKQATRGKKMMGLIVTDYNGQPISFWRGVLRYLGRIVSVVILLIGMLMALVTPRKQTLHDMLTKTLVVKAAAKSQSY